MKYSIIISIVMTITQVANMYLTFAIVLKSEFGDTSVTTFVMNAIYLTVTGIQVWKHDKYMSCSLYMLLEMTHVITKKYTESHTLSMDPCSCSPCSVRLFKSQCKILSIVTFYSMTAVDVFVLFAACASTFVIIITSIVHGQLFSILPTMLQYM